MTKFIEVIVSATGQVVLQSKGFGGSECRDATRALEQALGQSISEQLTADFHQTPSAHETNRQQA